MLDQCKRSVGVYFIINAMFLGIDYGKKRIGLALGEKFPKPFLVLENNSLNEMVEKIAQVCSENQVDKIIVGMPENRGQNSEDLISDIKKFATELSNNVPLEIVYEPEAYTSTEAETLLKDHKKYDRNDKGKVDAMAATLLLEQYINKRGEE